MPSDLPYKPGDVIGQKYMVHSNLGIYPPGSIIADRYEVAGNPLRGGMGIVYLCLDRPSAMRVRRKATVIRPLDSSISLRMAFKGASMS